jgi:AcrR family transcriptional regulator
MSNESEGSGAPADETTNRVEQVADAALRLFARYGYKRTSMDDIAKEAGLAKATLYLHFKGKDDVFRAMLALLGQRVDARCREVLASTGPFGERLAALLRAHHGGAFAAFGAGEHLIELKAVIASVAGEQLLAFEEIFVRHAQHLIAESEAAGEIRLARAGTSPAALITTLMQAAAGAKLGALPSCETYAARLDTIASVAAAAVTPDR